MKTTDISHFSMAANPIFGSPIFWVSLVLAVLSVPVAIFVLRRQNAAYNSKGLPETPIQDALAYIWVPLATSGTILMIGMGVAYRVIFG